MASVDDLETNTAFAEEHEANFPILSAPDKEMPEAYGVLSERGFCNRWTYYIDAGGTVVKIDKETSPPMRTSSTTMRTAARALRRELRSMATDAQSAPGRRRRFSASLGRSTCTSSSINHVQARRRISVSASPKRPNWRP